MAQLDCIYEQREIIHVVRYRGRPVVIERVPAGVCDICRDVLFTPDTVEHIEQLLASSREPRATAPVVAYS